ncbi:putative guanine deaminase [Colletotrichum sidae]|uniref:Guanine deaminase n=1 Tax=Colletotrichum sidae TaxID=1347389 RepID=A0A4R8TM67_9PEZI|nr:putative guanine deaminase [Colletotrichum sidae]
MGDMIRDPSPATRDNRNRLFYGTFIHSKTREELEYLHNTAVAVDASGTIVAVNKTCATSREAEDDVCSKLGWRHGEFDVRIAKEGQFFFPGFIDTHVHASQYPNVGIFGKSTLLDWLNTYTFPMEASLADLRKAKRVYTACVRRTLAHGTTTSAYYATIDVAATNLLADICLRLGQRAFVGRVCMDREGFCPDFYIDESVEQSVEKSRVVAEYIRGIDPGYELVAPILTPRFAPACTAPALEGLARLQKELDVLVQTHVSENEGEVALVAELFPWSKSYTDVYDKTGLLGEKMILAHAVHLSEEEATTIARRGAKVSHCPCSNSSITSGAARVRWMWDKGIDVGLGTDMSGGYSPSILEAARQAALVSRHVAMRLEGEEKERAKLTVDEVLFLATRGGAKVVGLGDKIGGFEVGKQWDAQLVGLAMVDEEGEADGDSNVDVFGWENWEERIAKWVYNGDDRNTKSVWVKGRLVHERR